MNNQNHDPVAQAEAAYEAALAAFDAVLSNGASTDVQIDKARAAYDRAQIAFGDAVLDNIAQRTAFLGTLVAALESVIDEVQINPVGDTLDELNSVLASVNTLIESDSDDPA